MSPVTLGDRSSGTIHTLVLSDQEEAANLIAALLAQADDLYVRAAPMAFGEGLKAIQRFDPQVVVVVDTLESPAAVVEQLDAAAPGIPSLAILPEGDLRGAQECNLAGARATLVKPFDHQSLVEAIRQVHLKEARRRQHVAAHGCVLLSASMPEGHGRSDR
jgi:DNA-binding NtrC family response regulator